MKNKINLFLMLLIVVGLLLSGCNKGKIVKEVDLPSLQKDVEKNHMSNVVNKLIFANQKIAIVNIPNYLIIVNLEKNGIEKAYDLNRFGLGNIQGETMAQFMIKDNELLIYSDLNTKKLVFDLKAKNLSEHDSDYKDFEKIRKNLENISLPEGSKNYSAYLTENNLVVITTPSDVTENFYKEIKIKVYSKDGKNLEKEFLLYDF